MNIVNPPLFRSNESLPLRIDFTLVFRLRPFNKGANFTVLKCMLRRDEASQLRTPVQQMKLCRTSALFCVVCFVPFAADGPSV